MVRYTHKIILPIQRSLSPKLADHNFRKTSHFKQKLKVSTFLRWGLCLAMVRAQLGLLHLPTFRRLLSFLHHNIPSKRVSSNSILLKQDTFKVS